MRLKRFLMDYSKWLIIGGAVVSALGAIATAIGGLMAGDKQAEETKAYNDSLKIKTDKIENLQDELITSQRKAADDQKAGFEGNQNALVDIITRAENQLGKSIETINYLTGGNSYCIVKLIIDNEGKAKVLLTHEGNYPIYNLTISIINTTKHDKGETYYGGGTERSGSQLPFTDVRSPQIVEVEELHPGTVAREVGAIKCERDANCTFMITTNARNGIWYERLLIWPAASVPYPYRDSYKILKKDPDNPNSNSREPNTLKVVDEVALPEFIPNRSEYDWFKGNWF